MIYKQCIMTINRNNATLDEDIYLFRLDKNIELHFTIVNNKYKFDKSDLNNIIAQTNAAYFQIRLYRSDEIKYTFAIQPTQDGVAVLTITDDLINDPIEVGEYDFQISLLDADKTSMISMPIVTKQLHVCEPLVDNQAIMGRAVLGLSSLASGEIKNAFDSEGNYIREIHKDGDILSASIINKFEDALDSNTKAIKNGIGTSYDDTEIKTDINTIKTDLGTEELTTTAKNVKGAVNEVAAQYKDIEKNFNGELEHKANIDSFNSNITYITNVYKSADNDLLSKIKYLTDYINNNLLAPYTFITSDLLNVNTTSSIDGDGQLIVSKSGTNAFTWTTFNKSQENNEFEFTINSNDCYFVLCANATKCIAIQLGVHVDDFGLITRWYADGLVENLNVKETDQTRKAIIGDVIKVSRIPSGWKMTKNSKEWLTVPFLYNDANLQTEFTESEKQYGVMKYNATENESVIKHCNIKKIIILPNSSQFNNKTWNAIGDSITWLNKYEPIVANALGISTVRNYGKSGFSTVMLKSDVSSWDNNADLISFFAGTNDFGRCDDLSTTENSADYIFSNLKTKYPNKKIVVCLPTQRCGYTGDTVNGSQPTMTNSKGIKLWQYCEIIMKKANQYDLPVLDLYNLSGITKDNINIYTADGLHPNDDGFKKISAVMIDFFNSI